MGKSAFDYENIKGIVQGEKERARMTSIGGQVKSSVLLSEFESVPASGGAYDTLEITLYRGTSARLKLPTIITEQLDKGKHIDICINHTGDIILLMPHDDGHNVSTDKAFKPSAVFSQRLARKLQDKGISLPVKYRVSTDENILRDKEPGNVITGWVCRKEL
jgi:hypothetical protein